jgi:uncharacterized protein
MLFYKEMKIQVRAYEELNDHLPPEIRKQRYTCTLPDFSTVEDLLSQQHIPNSEVELAQLNGNSVDVSRILEDGDFLSLYPVFESLNVKPLVRVRRNTLRETRFVADSELAVLSFWLRLLGFDVRRTGAWMPGEIVAIAEAEKRILLTRDPDYLRLPGLSRLYLVRETGLRCQLAAIISRFDLFEAPHFTWLQRFAVRILRPRP